MTSTSYMMPNFKMPVIKTSFQQETSKKYKFYQPNVPPLLILSEPNKRTLTAIKILPKNMSILQLVSKLEKERKNMLKV